MIDRLLRRTSEEIKNRELQSLSIREARAVIKKIEIELKNKDINGVLVYESDYISGFPLLSGLPPKTSSKEITLRWDLKMVEPSRTNKDGWVSREVKVGILGGREVIVGYNSFAGFGQTYTYTNWLEKSTEYLTLLQVREREGRTGPALEEKIRFAMDRADYKADHRFAKI